jgi:pimeloyl-ACP methyl ester carboxylesterase
MRLSIQPLAFTVSLLMFSSLALAQRVPDIEREQRMVEEIDDVIFDGDPIELSDGDRDFLAIFMEADEPKGTVIIAHGRGYHADWESVVNPLRVGLVEEGWNTLSIQLPVLEKSAKYFDYVDVFDAAAPRFEAATSFAKEQGGKVVLLAHSCGSHMAQRWIKNQPESSLISFDAYVGIGMGATDYKQPMVEPFQLDKMPMPVLDLYGSEDFPAVIRKAPERLGMIETAGHPKSAQVVVEGAEHYFKTHKTELIDAVSGWLKTL